MTRRTEECIEKVILILVLATFLTGLGIKLWNIGWEMGFDDAKRIYTKGGNLK